MLPNLCLLQGVLLTLWTVEAGGTGAAVSWRSPKEGSLGLERGRGGWSETAPETVKGHHHNHHQGGSVLVEPLQLQGEADNSDDEDTKEYHLERRGGKLSRKAKNALKEDVNCVSFLMKLFGVPPKEVWVRVTGGLVKVLKIPGNGDCLFAAVQHQLAVVRNLGVDQLPSVAELRRQVAEHLNSAKQDPVVAANILSSASEDPAFVSADPAAPAPNPNQLIDDFIEALGNSNTWGGTETIYALSELLRVGIRVYNENGSDYTLGEFPEELKICYRGSEEGRTHYDSVLEVRIGISEEEIRLLTRPQGQRGSPGAKARLDAITNYASYPSGRAW